MKLNKLKSLVLILISIVLSIVIIKYLKIMNGIYLIIRILAPVFVGLIYAWLFNPLINKLSLRYKRNIVCLGIFGIILLFIFLILYLLIPTVYREVQKLIDDIPDLISYVKSLNDNYGFNINFDKIGDSLINDVPKYVISVTKNIFKYLGIFAVGLILGLYASMDYDKLVSFVYDNFPNKYKNGFIKITNKISVEVRKCVNGTLLVAGIVFLLDTICFYILKLDVPLLLGFMCGLTDLIPYVGPYIGGGIAVLIALSKGKTLCILTIICCVCVQVIENNVLQPIVMSKTMKISPIFIIIGLLVFGNLFGVIGMILASPLVAIIKVILDYCNGNILKKKY